MKQIPIGIEGFKEIVEQYYFIDKRGLIKDIQGKKVVLYTRPRRFEKTLNMSMLKYFYCVKENAYLFEGLQISKDKDIMQHQNKYPVIHMSLKDMKKDTFDRQVNKFKSIISNIVADYLELLDSRYLDDREKEYMRLYRNKQTDIDDIEDSLLNLSICLEKHYGEKVVILIDEYDVPLQHAYLHGYYEEMVEFIRNVFSAVLKTNTSLQLGVLTGCLRIVKESIFTGLNNFSVYGITEEISAQYFGFTPQEVKQALKDYDLLAYEEEVKNWYDGYKFGNQEIYNPWSIINYLEQASRTSNQQPVSFWAKVVMIW